jgi:hypothetical protein
MAVFDVRYVTAHELTIYTTRASGFGSGPGGWARVPACSCGWNQPGWIDGTGEWRLSPRGSIFADHYENEDKARDVWQETHMDSTPFDAGRTLVASVRP